MATYLETTSVPSVNDGEPHEDSEFGDSVVLHGISWKLYRRLRKMQDNYNVRMTYDGGELEIMSPSTYHETIAEVLRDLVVVWAEETNLEIMPCRNMTIRRADLELGFEPDGCYYVQHESQMRGKKKINFKVDPPPDLAIEVEVSRKLGRKTEIYAAFGVPELWCCSGDTLTVLELSRDGQYVARPTSACLPDFPLANVVEAVRQAGTMGHISMIRSFRNSVRNNALPKR